jgi:hypothetical protein
VKYYYTVNYIRGRWKDYKGPTRYGWSKSERTHTDRIKNEGEEILKAAKTKDKKYIGDPKYIDEIDKMVKETGKDS